MGKPIAGEARPWPSPGASPQGSGEHNAFVCDLACTRSSAPKHQPFKRPVLPLPFPQQC